MTISADILFPRLVTFENLLEAYRKASRGKRGRLAAALFEYQLADHLIMLQEELINQQYRPGAYQHFVIREPKQRLISAAPFRDRVVHHALCNIIEPLFEARFHPHSYANRVGKGTHRAIDQLQAYARHYRYVLRLDIKQHFPSLDHAILKESLFQVIHDERVRELITVILHSGEGVLAGEYEMTIHRESAQVSPVTMGIPWLGFVVYPTYRRLKRRSVIHFRRRLEQNLSLYQQGEITFAELDASVQGWINHVRYGDTWGLRQKLFTDHSL